MDKHVFKFFFDRFTNTLEDTLILLKYMVNEHVFMNLV